MTLTSDRWKTLESMPTPIGGVGAAYVGGRLIAVGGETPEGASDAVQAYEIKKKTWSSSELPKLLNARHGVAVTRPRLLAVRHRRRRKKGTRRLQQDSGNARLRLSVQKGSRPT